MFPYKTRSQFFFLRISSSALGGRKAPQVALMELMELSVAARGAAAAAAHRPSSLLSATNLKMWSVRFQPSGTLFITFNVWPIMT